MTDGDTLIELDARRRASFGRVGRPEHTRYLVSEEDDGTLILTPATVVSDLEARFLQDPAVLTRIGQMMAQMNTHEHAQVRRGGARVRGYRLKAQPSHPEGVTNGRV